MAVGGNHWLQVPVAKNADGSPITGQVFGRIVNRSGPGAQPLIVQTNPVPYMPVSLDTTKANARLARSRNDATAWSPARPRSPARTGNSAAAERSMRRCR